MPKTIMDKLGLDITRPYGYLYSFDLIRVKCMGMIKDLVVTLEHVPVKSVLMDAIITDIPPSTTYYCVGRGEPNLEGLFNWI